MSGLEKERLRELIEASWSLFCNEDSHTRREWLRAETLREFKNDLVSIGETLLWLEDEGQIDIPSEQIDRLKIAEFEKWKEDVERALFTARIRR